MKVSKHPPVLMTIHEDNRITIVYPLTHPKKRVQVLIDEIKRFLDVAAEKFVPMGPGQYDVVITGLDVWTRNFEVEVRPL